MNVLNQSISGVQDFLKSNNALSAVADITTSAIESSTNTSTNNTTNVSDFDLTESFSQLLAQASSLFATESSESTETETSVASQATELALSAAASASLPDTSESALDSESSVVNIQSALLSSLGLSGLAGQDGNTLLSQLISTDDATASASLESLQSSFLASLQSSLFSAITNPASDLAASAVSTVDVSSQASTSSTTITDFSAGASSLMEVAKDITTQKSVMDIIGEFSFGEDGLDLTDGFDMVNILQHIPILSAVYRETTGDTLNAAAKLGGSFIYGGPVGLALSAADLAVEYATGTSFGDKLTSFNYSDLLSDEGGSSTTTTSSGSANSVSTPAPSFR